MSYFEAKTEYERDLEKHPESTTAWLSNTLGKNAYGGHYFRNGDLVVIVVKDQGIAIEPSKEAVSGQFKRHDRFHAEEGTHSRAALERAKELVNLKLARSPFKTLVHSLFKAVAQVDLIGNTVRVCIPNDPASKQEAEHLGLFNDPLLTVLRIDWDAHEQSNTLIAL